jgi:hypothetical protein
LVSQGKDREITTNPAQFPAERQLHPMVEKVLGLNPSVETLEKIMKMQEEWERNNAKRAFTEALVALKKALPASIIKDATANMGQGKPKYTYAKLANIVNQITPTLCDHGFSITTPATTLTDSKGQIVITVKATLTHCAGHAEMTPLSGPVDISGAKSTIQGIGSSITYLQRYAILSILGLATDDQPDADDAPSVEPAGGKVDIKLNMAALQSLATKHHKTKKEAEDYVGAPFQEWTSADLAKLKSWVAPPAAPATPAPEAREPGSDDAEDEARASIFDFHCDQCDFKSSDEGMLVDHQADTGHRAKNAAPKPARGTRSA